MIGIVAPENQKRPRKPWNIVWNMSIRAVPKSLFSLGVFYRREERHDDVMKCMKIVLDNDPYDVKAMVAMAEAAGAVGKVEVEKEMYERIVQTFTVTPEERADSYRNLGLCHKGENVQVEIEYYRKAIETYDNYHARYSLGRALFQAGELEQARDSFLAAYSFDTDPVSALKAIYRTARAILEKETRETTLALAADEHAQQKRLTELVGGEEVYNKIQSLMAASNPYAYQS